MPRILAVLIAFCLALPAAAQGLSPKAQALIAPVAEAIGGERARQSALPPPASDSEQLERMGALDQVGRRALTKIDLTVLPPEEIPEAREAMWRPIEAVDAENLNALLAMVPPEGWFLKSRYGEKAARAAFHIIQHSNEEQLRRFVPILEPLVATGEIEGQSFGLMFDRLAVAEGRPQRYGSQMYCVEGRWTPRPLENPSRVEALRKALNFPQTYAEYLEHWKTYPPCT